MDWVDLIVGVTSLAVGAGLSHYMTVLSFLGKIEALTEAFREFKEETKQEMEKLRDEIGKINRVYGEIALLKAAIDRNKEDIQILFKKLEV